MNIIKLVKSAGLYVGTNISGVTLVGGSPSNNKLIVHLDIEEMTRFAHLVRAQALEEAAVIAEEELANSNALAAYNTVQRIRALAKEKT